MARAGPVSSGSRVRRWPLISMVAERAVRRVWTMLLDADAGGVLQVAADGEGGEHDGQVGLDGLALWWNTGRARRSDLVIRNDASTCHSSW